MPNLILISRRTLNDGVPPEAEGGNLSSRDSKLVAVILVVVAIGAGAGYWLLIPMVPTETTTYTTQETLRLTSSERTRSSTASSTTFTKTFETSTQVLVVQNKSISYYLSLLESSGTELQTQAATELRRIPEVKQAMNDGNASITRSVMRIVRSILVTDEPTITERNLGLMLGEGIPEKREYCTPLQALVWFYMGNVSDGFNPLQDLAFSLNSFVSYVWRYSSTSDYWRSEKWKDFSEVVDRLNSPGLLGMYMQANFMYDGTVHDWRSPEVTFKMKRGHCGDQSGFATWALARNGYKAYTFWVKWGSGWFDQHTVTLFEDTDGSIYILENTGRYPGIHGPVRTIGDANSIMCYLMGRAKAPCTEYGFWDEYRHRLPGAVLIH